MTAVKEYPPADVLVREFQTIFKQIVRENPDVLVPERKLRLSLVDEETCELKVAYVTHDFVEVIDALADIVYVAVGAATTYGINLNLNIQKPLQLDPSIGTEFEEGEEISVELGSLAIRLHFAKTPERTKELLEAIVFACYRVSYCYGVDLDEILEEVHLSNMSKLDENGNPIFREGDNKVIKGPNYFVPNIGEVLLRQRERGIVNL